VERDTAPAVAARYDALMGALPGDRRLAIAAQLSAGARAMAEAGLRSRHPGAPDGEIRCRLAALLYGRAVAERLFPDVPADVPWRPPSGAVSDRQWRDVVQVLRQSRAVLDPAYLDEWAGRLGFEGLLARARAEAGSR